MRRAFSSDDARDSIRSSLLSRKVLQRLVEIIEGRDPEPASPPGLSADPSDDDAAVEPEEDDGSPTEEVVAAAASPSLEANEEGANPDAE